MSNLVPIGEYEGLTSLLTADEQVIVKELIMTTEPPSEVIPDDMSPTDLWRYLAAVCKGITRTQEVSARLKFFLGRILVQVQKNPELFTSQGYENFNNFITEGVPKLFGISRPEAYISKKISEVLGERLTIDEMENTGISKLNVASNAIRQRTPVGTPSDVVERVTELWVSRSKEMTLDEMKSKLAEETGGETGDFETVSVIFQVKESVYERLKEFRAKPWAKARAGESDSDLLEAFMAECASWEDEEKAEKSQ